MTYTELVEKIKTDDKGKKRTIGERTKKTIKIAREAILYNREEASKLKTQKARDEQTSIENNFATMVRMGEQTGLNISGVAFQSILNRKHYIDPNGLSDELIDKLKDHQRSISVNNYLNAKAGITVKQNIIIRYWGRQYTTASGELAYTKVERIYYFDGEFYSTRGGHWRRVDFLKLFVDMFANAEDIIEGYSLANMNKFIEDIFDLDIYEKDDYFSQDVKDRIQARRIISKAINEHNESVKVYNKLESTIIAMKKIGSNTKSMDNQLETLGNKLRAFERPNLLELISNIKTKREALKTPKNEVVEVEVNINEEDDFFKEMPKAPRTPKQTNRRKQKETKLVGYMIDEGFSVETYGGDKIAKDESGNIVSVPVDDIDQEIEDLEMLKFA